VFIFKEVQHLLGVAVPVIVQIGVFYLILRFTFAISNVLVRLSALNRPPKPVAVEEPEDEPIDAEFQEDEGEQAALPEKTGEN
jgi:hypothetical protein